MQHAEEAAAEPEAQRHGTLRFIGEGSIVEFQLLQRVAQIGILRSVLGVDAAVDHRSCRTVAGQRLRSRTLRLGNGVAHAGVRHILDAGRKVADVASFELFTRFQCHRPEISDFQELIPGAGGHEQHFGVFRHSSVHHAQEDDNPAIIVILTVKDQRLQRRIRVARWRGDVLDDVFQHCVDVDACLCADFRCILRGNADNLLDLVLDALRVGSREVDLVHHRKDFQIVVQGEIGIGECLCLDSLGRVDDQHCALAGRQ